MVGSTGRLVFFFPIALRVIASSAISLWVRPSSTPSLRGSDQLFARAFMSVNPSLIRVDAPVVKSPVNSPNDLPLLRKARKPATAAATPEAIAAVAIGRSMIVRLVRLANERLELFERR